MKNAKRLTLCGMLAAVAVVLSLVERMFPLDAIVPVPGVKLVRNLRLRTVKQPR